MINGDYKMFVEDLYEGKEMNFSYKDRIYFLQGWYDSSVYHMELIRFVPLLQKNLWEHSSTVSMYENGKEFMKSKIFDGKTFAEIESEVEWLDFTPDNIERKTNEYWQKHTNETPDGVV